MTLYPELIASVLYQASGSEVCAFLLLSVLTLWLCMCLYETFYAVYNKYMHFLLNEFS